MDRVTDIAITSHQGKCDLASSKLYYLKECSTQDKDALVDQHSFRVFKEPSRGYSIESMINESQMMTATPNMTITSVCANNNSEVETIGNVENVHIVSQGDNSSFNYTFKRYYSKDNKMYGCQYQSNFEISLVDMFGVSENQGEIVVFSRNAANVSISVSELNIEWYVNHLKIDSLDNVASARFDNDTLRRYTNANKAIVYLIIDGIRFQINSIYNIDRNQYKITSVTQSDRIEGLGIKKKIYVDHNFRPLAGSVLFIDNIQISETHDYNENMVGKTIVSVMHKLEDPVPSPPFIVGENGVVNIRETVYLAETVSEPYLQDGYFDLSSVNGSISGLHKSVELPVERIVGVDRIQNYTESKAGFFGTSKQLLFSNKIAPVVNGGVSVKNELGNHELYRLEDLISTEPIFQDREDIYVFRSRSDFVDNTNWTINNINGITFEIDSGRVYGDNINMVYDAGVNEIRKVSLGILWTTSISGSNIQIYGIRADGTETLYVEARNVTTIMSSIFSDGRTKTFNFNSYRFTEFIELEQGIKKIRIKANRSNIMFENLKLTLKRL